MSSPQPTGNKFVEHARVRLRAPLPEHGLEAGDQGTIVHTYCLGDLEVEFSTKCNGQRVVMLRADMVEPAQSRGTEGEAP